MMNKNGVNEAGFIWDFPQLKRCETITYLFGQEGASKYKQMPGTGRGIKSIHLLLFGIPVGPKFLIRVLQIFNWPIKPQNV